MRYRSLALLICGVMACSTPDSVTSPDLEQTAEAPSSKGGGKPGDSGWTLMVLDPLPGADGSTAAAVNDAGIIVGESSYGSSRIEGFLRVGSQVVSLDPVDGDESMPRALSSGNPLAGESVMVAGGVVDGASVTRPSRWTVFLDKGKLAVSHEFRGDNGIANGINDRGDLVGAGDGGATIWYADKSPEVIPPPSGYTRGEARDINNDGMVTLVFRGNGVDRAFLRLTNGFLKELPPFPGDSRSYAWGLSEVRADGTVIVAGTTRRSETEFHPVRWVVRASDGEIQTATMFPQNGSAGSVSDGGVLAGSLARRNGISAALWTELGTIALPVPRRTLDSSVSDISPDGRIAVGYAANISYRSAILWTRKP